MQQTIVYVADDGTQHISKKEAVLHNLYSTLRLFRSPDINCDELCHLIISAPLFKDAVLKYYKETDNQ